MRLNQFLAGKLGLTRRQVDHLIQTKKIKLNGTVASLGQKIGVSDHIEIFNQSDGTWRSIQFGPRELEPTIVSNAEPSTLSRSTQALPTDQTKTDPCKPTTILFYKPIFTSTKIRPGIGQLSLYNRLPIALRHLRPLGHLPYLAEGLVVLTNDPNLLKRYRQMSLTRQLVVGFKPATSNLSKLKAMTDLAQNQFGWDLEYQILTPEELDQYIFYRFDRRHSWFAIKLKGIGNPPLVQLFRVSKLTPIRCLQLAVGDFRLSPNLSANQFVEMGPFFDKLDKKK
jgi:16S rRNA U516 pseudouridylate synthase RsuA-like enzyme